MRVSPEIDLTNSLLMKRPGSSKQFMYRRSIEERSTQRLVDLLAIGGNEIFE